MNNRTTIWNEMKAPHEKVIDFHKEEFIKLLKQPCIHEWISGNLEYNEQCRVDFITGRLKYFTSE
ncbi:MAG: hypothetical protein ABI707_11990 [Ferruginibacter sp.]